MTALERFLNDVPEPTPPLLKAALTHVQFETIHPFLDGNGRLGRMLITLLLCEQGVLRVPMLYLSFYFKAHRQDYYERLNDVRLSGDWERWLDFFAEAVIATADQVVETVRQLRELLERDRGKIGTLKRVGASALSLHLALAERPLTTVGWLAEKTGLTQTTVNKSLGYLEQIGIVKELTGYKRNRQFKYVDYLEIMERGTELPTE